MTSSDGLKSAVSIVEIAYKDTINTLKRNNLGCYIWLKRWHIYIEDIESPITTRHNGIEFHIKQAFVGKKKDAEKWLVENGGSRFLPLLKHRVSSRWLL